MTNNEQLIASANTARGFAIGIVKSANYRTGRDQFQVVRMDRRSRYITISRHSNEAKARQAANAEYRAEMTALALAA